MNDVADPAEPGDLVQHYGGAGLVGAIDRALAELDVEPSALTVELLGPVDEFHVGGRPATERLVDQLNLRPGAHVLDLGCGIGGTARHLAGLGARVTGVDLTAAYVEAGRELNRRVGLDDRIELHIGSVLDLPFDSSSSGSPGFDCAVMLHVGMNLADKGQLMTEVARVLRPGATFGLYDLMRVGDGPIEFPVPWSSVSETSHVESVEIYRLAAEAAGFTVVAQTDRRTEAAAFFERLRSAGGPPSPLGLHLLMGPQTPTKVANMIAAVEGGIIAPTELILTR